MHWVSLEITWRSRGRVPCAPSKYVKPLSIKLSDIIDQDDEDLMQCPVISNFLLYWNGKREKWCKWIDRSFQTFYSRRTCSIDGQICKKQEQRKARILNSSIDRVWMFSIMIIEKSLIICDWFHACRMHTYTETYTQSKQS